MQKELTIKKDYNKVGEEISHELAAEFILSYDKAYPADLKWFCMGKEILTTILSQPGCAGIRFYNGINENGQKTLVYVGIDSEGVDIINRTVVQHNGEVTMNQGTTADRNPGGFDLLGWIFGK
jgi:hypothetical protein